MMMTWLHLAFAGLWGFLFHWGTGVALIGLCLLGAYGTQLINVIPLVGPFLSAFFTPLRKDLLWAAAAIALFLAGQAIGAHDEAVRCAAKAAVIDNVVKNAVDGTDTPAAQKQPDPFDNPEN